MNKSTKTLISVAKITIVIGLLAYVFFRIQWQDTVVVTESGESIATITGEIKGNWNNYPIEFLTVDGRQLIIETSHQTTHQISPGFFTYLKQTNPYWLFLGALAFITVAMFSAFRWHWLVNSQRLSLNIYQAIRLTWIGIFFNNFVPGQTGGDLVKAYCIAKNSPQKRLTAVLTVIADRIIGLSALVVVSIVTVTIFFDRFKEIAITLWLGLLIGTVIAIILLKRSIRRKLGLSALVNKLPTKINEQIHNLDTAIRQYHDHKQGVFTWWLLSIINHIINMLGIYALSRSINMGVPAVEFLALVPVIFIVSAIPIAPNGWGIGEALFGNLFGQYGATYLPNSANAEQIMSTRGVALSILFRIMSMCISLIGGLFLLLSKDKLPTKDTDNEPAIT